MRQDHPAERPCLHCGGAHFTWGMANGVVFMPKSSLNVKLAEVFAPLTTARRNRMSARRCEGCGNVQFFSGLQFK